MSLGEVIRAVEGPMSSLKYRVAGSKDMSGVACGLYSVMKDVSTAVSDIVDNITLRDMAAKTTDLIEQRKGVPNYVI